MKRFKVADVACGDSHHFARERVHPIHNMCSQAQEEARKFWERSGDEKPIPLWLDCDTGRATTKVGV